MRFSLIGLLILSAPCYGANPPSYEEFIGTLAEEVQSCKNEIADLKESESRRVYDVYSRLSQQLEGRFSELSSQMLEKAKADVLANRNDQIVCPSALLDAYGQRLERLEEAVMFGLDEDSRPQATPIPEPVVRRFASKLPVDVILYDPIGLCPHARLLHRCATIRIGAESFHGDMFVNFDGERTLLVHRRRESQPRVQFVAAMHLVPVR